MYVQISPNVRLTLIPAQRLSEGAGVTVHRTIGTAALRTLDPFLMLDHFNSTNPGDYIAGFPDHPHRGFVTFTYLIEGHMLHRDSMGHKGDLVTGGAQWMKAARGIIHSEMPQQTQGRMSGFQLWINLPAREKMSDPQYRDLLPSQIPVIEEGDARIRLLAGTWAGQEGALTDPLTHLLFADLSLRPHGTLELPEGALNGETAFLYGIEGDLSVSGQTIPGETLAVLASPRSSLSPALSLKGGSEGARVLLVSGRPIGEPVVAYGPFVMNTREEIERAIEDYRNNRFV